MMFLCFLFSNFKKKKKNTTLFERENNGERNIEENNIKLTIMSGSGIFTFVSIISVLFALLKSIYQNEEKIT